MKTVEMKGIKKTFQSGESTVMAVKDVSLDVNKGEFVAIMRKSGSGKTTLLNILATLEQPDEGTYLLDGQEMTRLTERQKCQYRQKKIGVVYQQYQLLRSLQFGKTLFCHV